MRGLWALLILAPGLALAQDGQDAFQSGDYPAARAAFQAQADEGDARALFDLGTMADLGLGEPRDPAKAFRLYLAAADRGIPEAQFNVAVMLDTGTLRAAEPAAASVWYARAAANGMDRAAYNLGQAYATGRGVPLNNDLARYWLGRTEVTAAAKALETLPSEPAPDDLVAPTAVGAFRLEDRVELVWTTPPSGGADQAVVELVEIAGGRRIEQVTTPASAIVLPIPVDAPPLAWRVLRMEEDGSDYAASDWSAVDSDTGLPPFFGARVVFRPGDDDARRLAESLSADFAVNGIAARVDPGPDPDATSVQYSMAADRALALDVAAVLPGIGSGDVAQDAGLEPGEIAVRLAGGIAP